MMTFSLLLTNQTQAQTCNETQTLAKVLYAEARGQPDEGVIAVGNTLVRRKLEWKPKQTICEHAKAAYQQKAVPRELSGYYQLLATGLLSGQIADVTKGADSFDSLPRKPKGRWTRRIGKHQFYVMQK